VEYRQPEEPGGIRCLFDLEPVLPEVLPHPAVGLKHRHPGNPAPPEDPAPLLDRTLLIGIREDHTGNQPVERGGPDAQRR
jgi:hypothetical protein